MTILVVQQTLDGPAGVHPAGYFSSSWMLDAALDEKKFG